MPATFGASDGWAGAPGAPVTGAALGVSTLPLLGGRWLGLAGGLAAGLWAGAGGLAGEGLVNVLLSGASPAVSTMPVWFRPDT
ncbi:MAG TPA: hypothetical protein VFN40_12680 [Gemmatimonadales bacterium]|nr:hypothetical protein [Gemmatimonadales bacterium]